MELEGFLQELDQELRMVMDVSDLSAREYEVISARWMCSGEPQLLEQVAKERHVTRERVRQIEAKGFRKMREHKERLQTLFETSDQVKREIAALEARLRLLDAIRWRKPLEGPWKSGGAQGILRSPEI